MRAIETILNKSAVVLLVAGLFAQTIYADKQEEFRAYLNEAKTLKGSVAKSTAAFSPEKTFDNYTSNPASAGYYSEDNAGASQTMKSDSISNRAIKEEGQAIAESSKIRPQFKINHESEEIKKSKEIQTLASGKIKGTLEEFISGKEDQVDTKETKYVIKTCNEEIRSLKRVCTKSPIVNASMNSVLYPNCHLVSIVQAMGRGRGGLQNNCPTGYSFSVFLRTETGMRMNLCVKKITTINEGSECYSGYYTHEPSDATPFGKGSVLVPKNRHARLVVTNYAPRDCGGNNERIVVTNTTTNTTVHNTAPYNGQVLNLPFSQTTDQKFSFYLSASRYRPVGVVLAYVEHEYKEPKYSITWKEDQHDI